MAILFTSGTTGFPKGAVSTHRGELSALANWGFDAALRIATGSLEEPEEDPEFQPSILMPLPLFHIGGSHASLLASFGVGRKVVMMYKWDPEQALDLIERERITPFLGVPTMTWELLQSPSLSKRDIRSLSAVAGGGAPNAGGMVERLQERMPDQHWRFGWGMTETNSGGMSNTDEGLIDRPDSCGKPTPIIELKSIDRDGNELPPGEPGELVVKSVTNIRCYWRQPEATAETIRDGWLRTGDIAEIDEEGYVYIRDREKDMVLRGGENIYCAEIERVVYLHPAVFEAAAFGVPDPRLGEELAVVVMPRPGADLDPAAVRTHVARHLARFKVPRYVWLQDEQLPRNSTGKIQERALRDRMLRQAADSRSGGVSSIAPSKLLGPAAACCLRLRSGRVRSRADRREWAAALARNRSPRQAPWSSRPASTKRPTSPPSRSSSTAGAGPTGFPSCPRPRMRSRRAWRRRPCRPNTSSVSSRSAAGR